LFLLLFPSMVCSYSSLTPPKKDHLSFLYFRARYFLLFFRFGYFISFFFEWVWFIWWRGSGVNFLDSDFIWLFWCHSSNSLKLIMSRNYLFQHLFTTCTKQVEADIFFFFYYSNYLWWSAGWHYNICIYIEPASQPVYIIEKKKQSSASKIPLTESIGEWQ
jgi:hypothetical protein